MTCRHWEVGRVGGMKWDGGGCPCAQHDTPHRPRRLHNTRCTLIMKSFACLLPGNQNTDSYGTYRAHAWHCISDIWRKVYSRMRAGDVRGKQSRSYEINTRRTEGRMEVKGWPHPWATPTEEHNRWAELCSFAWQNLNKTNPGCFFSERCSSVGWSDFHRCIYSCQS